MSQDSHRRKKVQICSTSPGYPVYCPKCNSTNVLIFFDPRFTPRLQSKWDELIDEKRILLENRWEKIKDENKWGELEKGSEKPNWICKDCYDGGIIVEKAIDKKIAVTNKTLVKVPFDLDYWKKVAQEKYPNGSFTIVPTIVDSGYDGPQSSFNNLNDLCSIARIKGYTISSKPEAIPYWTNHYLPQTVHC